MERTTSDLDRQPETGTEDEARGDEGLTTADLASARAAGAAPPVGAGDRSGPAGAAAGSSLAAGPAGEAPEQPLFDDTRSGDLRSRWETIQASFVDEPRRAVEDADGLVAEVLQELARSFTRQRESLEQEWQRGDDVSTEDLRQALRHYRSFFDRLLSL